MVNHEAADVWPATMQGAPPTKSSVCMGREVSWLASHHTIMQGGAALAWVLLCQAAGGRLLWPSRSCQLGHSACVATRPPSWLTVYLVSMSVRLMFTR